MRGVGTGSPQALERGERGLQTHRALGSGRILRPCFSAGQQELLNQKQARKRKRQPQLGDAADRGDRARRTAAAGAFWNATSGLVSSRMEMTDSRAGKLIPNSGLNSGTHVSLDDESWPCWHARRAHHRPAQCLSQDQGPQGVLASVFLCISRGALPPSARWLTRTRLCWQRKKNDPSLLPRPWTNSCGRRTQSAWSVSCRTVSDWSPWT